MASLFERITGIQEQARGGDVPGALANLRDLILDYPLDIHLWWLFVELATEPDDLRFALESILELVPGDPTAEARLALMVEVRAEAKELPGVAMGVKVKSDGSEQPAAHLTPSHMRRFGYKRGDFVRLRGKDGTVLPAIVEESSALTDDAMRLNSQALRLLGLQDGDTVTVLPPERLMLVVDTSGSMGNRFRLGMTRLGGVKKAVNLLLDVKARDADDLVGLIQFDSTSRILILPGTNYREVRAAVKKMRLGGATDMLGGLQRGLSTLRSAPGFKRIILLTDGVPTTSSDTDILGLAHQAKAVRVVIDTIGLGMPGQREYNESLLRGIAEITHGTFRKVEDLETLEETFEQLAIEKRYLLTD